MSMPTSMMLCIVALRVGVGGWKLYHRVCKMALPIHFFSHWATTHIEQLNRQNICIVVTGQVTMVIPDAAFSVVQCCSYSTIHHKQYDWPSLRQIPLLFVSCCHKLSAVHLLFDLWHTMWVKKIPPEVFWHLPQTVGNFLTNFFTQLLYVPVYARLQIFIQISPTVMKLCHI